MLLIIEIEVVSETTEEELQAAEGDKPQLTEGGTVAYTRPTKPLSVRCTTLCDKVCQRLATGWWFSLGPPVSSTNKTDRHNIIAILLKVALSTIKQTNKTSLKV